MKVTFIRLLLAFKFLISFVYADQADNERPDPSESPILPEPPVPPLVQVCWLNIYSTISNTGVLFLISLTEVMSINLDGLDRFLKTS